MGHVVQILLKTYLSEIKKPFLHFLTLERLSFSSIILKRYIFAKNHCPKTRLDMNLIEITRQ